MGSSGAVIAGVPTQAPEEDAAAGKLDKVEQLHAADDGLANCLLREDGGSAKSGAAAKSVTLPQLPTLLTNRFADDLVGKTPGGSQYLFPNTPMSYYTGVKEAPAPESPVRYYQSEIDADYWSAAVAAGGMF